MGVFLLMLTLLGGRTATAAPRKQLYEHHEVTRYVSSGHARVAIVGAGAVGATTAYAIMLANIAAEIILVDARDARSQGEVLDLSDALPLSSTAYIRKGSFRDAARADIIVITAGARRRPGQSRLDLITTNQKVMADVFDAMGPLSPTSVVIVVSNPVDIMTYCAQKLTNLPPCQVFGSGTYLDTQRLRVILSGALHIAEQSIQAYILGEHGDSQFAVFSSAQCAGVPLACFDGMTRDVLDGYAQAAKQKGCDIIALKEATFYGISACITDLCRSILFDQKRVLPVSCYVEDLGVCLSMPAIIGENGIERILSVPLDEQEREKLEQSAYVLRQTLDQCAS